MNLFLYFANACLGVLKKTTDGYVYNSKTANECHLMEYRNLEYMYKLANSIERKSEHLFPEFIEMVRELRKDILESAGIKSQDSYWTKLVKLSRLKWYPGAYFYVKQHKSIAAPEFCPNGGGDGDSVLINIYTATDGATLRFTTDPEEILTADEGGIGVNAENAFYNITKSGRIYAIAIKGDIVGGNVSDLAISDEYIIGDIPRVREKRELFLLNQAALMRDNWLDGIAEGAARTQAEIARRLLRENVPQDKIAELTDLSEVEIRHLAGE